MKNKVFAEIEKETNVYIGLVGHIPLAKVDDFKTQLTTMGLKLVYIKMSVDPLWIVRKEGTP